MVAWVYAFSLFINTQAHTLLPWKTAGFPRFFYSLGSCLGIFPLIPEKYPRRASRLGISLLFFCIYPLSPFSLLLSGVVWVYTSSFLCIYPLSLFSLLLSGVVWVYASSFLRIYPLSPFSLRLADSMWVYAEPFIHIYPYHSS